MKNSRISLQGIRKVLTGRDTSSPHVVTCRLPHGSTFGGDSRDSRARRVRFIIEAILEWRAQGISMRFENNVLTAERDSFRARVDLNTAYGIDCVVLDYICDLLR